MPNADPKLNPKRPVLRMLALDYAGLSNQVTGIERQISQMYGKAGVEVRWRTAHYKKGKQGYQLVGATPGGTPDATIRFMPDATGLPTGNDDGAAGVSVPGSNLANVIMDRVYRTAYGAGQHSISPDALAALAGSHEIGHAVFSFGHTPQTIMREDFSPHTVAGLQFSNPWNPQQIAAIRGTVNKLEANREAAAPKPAPVPAAAPAPHAIPAGVASALGATTQQ